MYLSKKRLIIDGNHKLTQDQYRVIMSYRSLRYELRLWNLASSSHHIDHRPYHNYDLGCFINPLMAVQDLSEVNFNFALCLSKYRHRFRSTTQQYVVKHTLYYNYYIFTKKPIRRIRRITKDIIPASSRSQ